MSATQFLIEFTKELIKVEPMKRHDVITEWAKKLEKLMEEETTK